MNKLSASPWLVMRKKCKAIGQASAVISKAPPRCKKGAVTWSGHETESGVRKWKPQGVKDDGRKRRRRRRVTWKERSKVVHSLPHRSDKTAVATTENVRLTAIPI